MPVILRSLKDILLSRGIRKENGCLEWPFAKDRLGYGKYWYREKVRPIHRIVAHLIHGFDIEDHYIKVLHSCDNPPCYEPSHLIVGNQSLNMKDAYQKGRRSKIISRDSWGRFI
jgi:hypothetical protein